MRIAIVATISAMLLTCPTITTGQEAARVQTGMTKEEVERLLGSPTGYTSSGGVTDEYRYGPWVLKFSDNRLASIVKKDRRTPAWVYLVYLLGFIAGASVLAVLIQQILHFKRYGYVHVPLPRLAFPRSSLSRIGRCIVAGRHEGGLAGEVVFWIFWGLVIFLGLYLFSPNDFFLLGFIALNFLVWFVVYVVDLGRKLAAPDTPSAGSIFVMFALSVLMPIVGLGLACCALSSSENRHLGMPFLLAAMFAFAIYFAGAYLGGAFTGAN